LHALVIAGAIVVIFVVVLLLSSIWVEIGSPLRKIALNAGVSAGAVAYSSMVWVWMIPDSLGYFLGGLFCGICLKRKWWVSALIAGAAFLIFDSIMHYHMLRALPDLPNRRFDFISMLELIRYVILIPLAVLGSAIPSIVRRSRRKAR